MKYKNWYLASLIILLPTALLTMSFSENINNKAIPASLMTLIRQNIAKQNLEEIFNEQLTLQSKNYSKEIKESIVDFIIKQLQERYNYTQHYIYNWLNNKLKQPEAKKLRGLLDQEKIIDLLKQYPTNKRLNSELIDAVKNENLEKVKELVQQKSADVNAQNPLGVTPLMFAIHAGNFPIAKFLIDSGADVNAQDNFKQTTLRVLASEKIPLSKLAQLLIDAGAQVNIEDQHGKTALDTAFSRLSQAKNLSSKQQKELNDFIKILLPAAKRQTQIRKYRPFSWLYELSA